MPKCPKCGTQLPEIARFCFQCGTSLDSQCRKKARRQRGNGTGSAYRRGKTWTAVYVGSWYVHGDHMVPRKFTKGGFSTKTEALNYIPILKKRAEKEAGKQTFPLEITKDMLLSLYHTYESGKMTKLSNSKQVAYGIAWSKLEEIMYCRIQDLTIDDLQTLVDRKAATYYPARDIQSVLSHIYKLAMAQNYVNVNLARFLTLPDLEEAEQKPFIRQEIEMLWSDFEAGNVFTGYILLMCYSGMMPGELMTAEKSNIDWEKQQIINSGLKTGTRKKTPIVIADFMIPVLHTLCQRSNSKYLLGMSRDSFYKEFHATLTRLCIEDRPPYSCRHTAATELVLDGASLAIVQRIMRHAKLTSTQRYIHIDTGTMLDAVNQLAPSENGNLLTTQRDSPTS